MKTFCIQRSIAPEHANLQNLMLELRSNMASELSQHLTRTDEFFVAKESLFNGEVILSLTVHVDTDAH